VRQVKLFGILLGLMLAFGSTSLNAKTVIKFASLAPKGSAWMKILYKWRADIVERTNGELDFKFYPGGVHGDDKDIVRKVKAGQIHGCVSTNVGMGEIRRDFLVFNAPALFKSYKELDYVRKDLMPDLQTMFNDAGFQHLGWGDVGWVYTFSNTPFKVPGDMKKAKMWAWTDDPIAVEYTREAGTEPVIMGVPDVLPGLQTGKINALYCPPYAALSLQWFAKVKYMTPTPNWFLLAASVVSKKFYDGLSEEHKTILNETSQKWHRKIRKRTRKDNKKTIKLFVEKAGIEIVELTDQEQAEWKTVGDRVRKKLVGKIYSKELLDKINKSLKKYRAGK